MFEAETLSFFCLPSFSNWDEFCFRPWKSSSSTVQFLFLRLTSENSECCVINPHGCEWRESHNLPSSPNKQVFLQHGNDRCFRLGGSCGCKLSIVPWTWTSRLRKTWCAGHGAWRDWWFPALREGVMEKKGGSSVDLVEGLNFYHN